jgi:hypothetical protein
MIVMIIAMGWYIVPKLFLGTKLAKAPLTGQPKKHIL